MSAVMKDELEYDRQKSLGRGEVMKWEGQVCCDRAHLQGSSNLAGVGRTQFGGGGMRRVNITRPIVGRLTYTAKESLVFCP